MLNRVTNTAVRSFSSASKAPARIAVAGCGGWTQIMHLPNLSKRDDCVITAVVDPIEVPGVSGLLSGSSDVLSMDKLADKYNSKWYKTLDVLLADKSCEIDGVVVCS